MFSYFKKLQSGRSMIEMIGVLAIIGVLSAGGIMGYSMAMSSYKANKAVDTLDKIVLFVLETFGISWNPQDDDAVKQAVIDANIGVINPFTNSENDFFILSLNFRKEILVGMKVLDVDSCVKTCGILTTRQTDLYSKSKTYVILSKPPFNSFNVLGNKGGGSQCVTSCSATIEGWDEVYIGYSTRL